MIEIGKKDKIFVAVAVPMAVLAALYFWGVSPVEKDFRALVAERANLPDPDMFPLERRALEKRVAEVERTSTELAAEAPPEALVVADAAASCAARQDALVSLLVRKGVRLVRLETLAEQPLPDAGSRGREALRTTGVCPLAEGRRLTLEGDYGQVREVLAEIATRRLAIVPEALSLKTTQGVNQWEVTVWL